MILYNLIVWAFSLISFKALRVASQVAKTQLFRCLSRHSLCVSLSQDGHVEVARLLLDSGAQVNMPADSFESPLTLAACGGHVELAALLIERGANLEEVCEGTEPK